ncbi:MAG: ATP-binding protein, partial [Planctomycetota bacterium]|nr:ATP-binding protein [Planctomycetota bacterium]
REVLRTVLAPLYARHRAAIDETVELSRHAAALREEEAHAAVLMCSTVLVMAVLATLGLSAAISWTVLRREHLAHAALEHQRAQLSALINHTPAAIALLDRHGAFIATSREWRSIVPSVPGDAGSDNSVTGAGLQASHWIKSFEKCLAGSVVHQDREVWQGEQGERFIQWDMRPWRTADGQIAGVTVCVQDITIATRREMELERLKEAAEQASRAKTEFLTNISHEIRTPLTAILGNTDILRETGDIDAVPRRRIELIDTISSAGQHLLTMINDILSLSELEGGRIELERSHVKPRQIIDDVLQMHRATAKQKGLTLSVQVGPAVPEHIETDSARLRQMLINLVGNAVKFTAAGSVRVEASYCDRSQPSSLNIDVIDTGQGINAVDRDRLFNAFTQADGGLTRLHGGTGLGLALCRKLAEFMGGKAELIWSEPGRGSQFRVSIPAPAVQECQSPLRLTDAAPETARTAGQPDPSVLRGRILLVEDGLDNQRLISFHLRKAGAVVEIAENGTVAISMIAAAESKGQSFQLIVSDMQMPEMDGYSLARTLRKAGNAIAIIALTAHAMDGDRRSCMDAGCDDYATKPIDRQKLIAMCALWLGRQSISPRLAAA